MTSSFGKPALNEGYIVDYLGTEKPTRLKQIRQKIQKKTSQILELQMIQFTKRSTGNHTQQGGQTRDIWA